MAMANGHAVDCGAGERRKHPIAGRGGWWDRGGRGSESCSIRCDFEYGFAICPAFQSPKEKRQGLLGGQRDGIYCQCRELDIHHTTSRWAVGGSLYALGKNIEPNQTHFPGVDSMLGSVCKKI